LEPSSATRTKFTSLIQNELPHETYLQLADWYYSLGLLNESMEVLSLAPPNPEVYYWMAFLDHQLKGKNGMVYLNKANALSPQLVFPFRSNSAEVLTWVITQSQDWKPKYYLALIYWSRNNTTEAKELFKQCGSPDFAAFYAARTSLMQDQQFADDLKKASQLDPREWRYGKMLVTHFIETKNYAEAVNTASQYHSRFPEDFRINMLLAKALLMNKQYKASGDLLDKTTILPYEGATDGRQLYREAWLMQAMDHMQRKNYKTALNEISKSRLWPENLGVGKPYEEDIDTRFENYLEGLCYENLKNPAQAKKKWDEVIAYKSNFNNVNSLVTALALRKANKQDLGEELLIEWTKKDPENKVAHWCLEMYRHNQSQVDVNFEANDNLRLTRAMFQLK
ncbi:MAG: DUF5107 domain-containing protein, partial [Marivirga sp.]|nr:DUF5107 domain-containing protein [Marivirga sp.]